MGSSPLLLPRPPATVMPRDSWGSFLTVMCFSLQVTHWEKSWEKRNCLVSAGIKNGNTLPKPTTRAWAHSVGAGAGQVRRDGAGRGAVVRQEVVKAVEVSGGAGFGRRRGRRLAGSTDQQVDSLSAGLAGQGTRSVSNTSAQRRSSSLLCSPV